MEQLLRMKHSQNNYDNQMALIEDDNVNVSSTNDAKDFVILCGGIIGFVLIFLLAFDYVFGFVIDSMPRGKLLQIESFFTFNCESNINNKYKKELATLERIKYYIMHNDKSIQNTSDFDIKVVENKEVNAMVYPNGSIIFTSGLLDKKLSEQELAFVLAHEMGHYANRDHLKSISKQVAVIILSLATGQSSHVSSIAHGVSETEFLTHSRNQERKADLYAGSMLIKIYGTNEGGKQFIKRIQENEKTPEFIHYFSTHPSWNQRVKLLNSQR